MKGGFKSTILVLTMVFLVGWLSNSVYSGFNTVLDEKPQKVTIHEINNNKERNSPGDHIKEDQIHVYKNKITLDIEGAQWARFTDTNSMDPIIDTNSNSIELKPNKQEDIHLGDIVSYRSKYADGIIIHRVVEIGTDNDGWYARLKGDNLDKVDPGKVRFNQIEGVVVGIIY